LLHSSIGEFECAEFCRILQVVEDVSSKKKRIFETHLPYLAEFFPLRGEAIRWEELRDVVPVNYNGGRLRDSH